MSDSSSPTPIPPSSRPENFPPGYFLIRNSIWPGVDWVVAIENDRCSSLPGMSDVGVLAGLELEGGRLHRLEPQRHDVAGHRLDRRHRCADILDRHAAEQFVLVEVQQLDRAVAERV